MRDARYFRQMTDVMKGLTLEEGLKLVDASLDVTEMMLAVILATSYPNAPKRPKKPKKKQRK